jgi:hypothetical protein
MSDIIEDIIDIVDENIKGIVAFVAVLLIVTYVVLGGGSCITFWGYVFTPPTPTPIVNASNATTITPTATATIIPTVTAIVNASTPTPTPTPRPTVTPRPPARTPDTPITENITPMSVVDYDRVHTIDKSIIPGMLAITENSYYGSPYAYKGDTWTMKINLQNGRTPVDKIRIRTTVIKDGGDHTLYQNERTDNVYLMAYDEINRTIGFKIPDDAPFGDYKVRVTITVYSPYTGRYSNDGAYYIGGFSVL